MPFFGGGGGGSGGSYILLSNDNITGGANVMPLVTGANNIGLGNNALLSLVDGVNNKVIGSNSLKYNTSGSDNVVIGDDILSDPADNAISGSVVILSQMSADLTDCVYIGPRISVYSQAKTDNVAIGSDITLSGGGANPVRCVLLGADLYCQQEDVTIIGNNNTSYHSGVVIVGRGLISDSDDDVVIGNATNKIQASNQFYADGRIEFNGRNLEGMQTFTFATLPSAPDYAGFRVFVSDIGINGSVWYSNGTRWLPVGGRVVLYRSTTPITFSTATETLMHQMQLPAGFLRVGDNLRYTSKLSKGGTSDVLGRNMRIGLAGTTADTLIYQSNLYITAANVVAYDRKDMYVKSSTLLLRGSMSAGASTYGPTNPAQPDQTIPDVSNSLYISLFAFFSTFTTDTGTCQFFELEYVAG